MTEIVFSPKQEILESCASYKLGTLQFCKLVENQPLGKKEVFILHTLMGQCSGTNNTEALTPSGFKKLSLLKDGDVVAFQRFSLQEKININIEQIQKTFKTKQKDTGQDVIEYLQKRNIPTYYMVLLLGSLGFDSYFYSDSKRVSISFSSSLEQGKILKYILDTFQVSNQLLDNKLIITDHLSRVLQSYKGKGKIEQIPNWIIENNHYAIPFLQSFVSKYIIEENGNFKLDFKLTLSQKEWYELHYSNFFQAIIKLFKRFGITFFLKTPSINKEKFQVFGYVHPKYNNSFMEIIGLPLNPLLDQKIRKVEDGVYFNKYTNASTSVIKWVKINQITKGNQLVNNIRVDKESFFAGGALVRNS